MATVTIHEAKTNLSKLIVRALDGEEIVIAKGAEPKVKLVPLVPKIERKPGRWKGRVEWSDSFFDPLPEDELRRWEGHKD